jgi:hypothetical protein
MKKMFVVTGLAMLVGSAFLPFNQGSAAKTTIKPVLSKTLGCHGSQDCDFQHGWSCVWSIQEGGGGGDGEGHCTGGQ